MRLLRAGLLVLVVLLAALFAVGRAQAAVVISSFEAIPSSGQVLVRWETASEIDVIGFYLQRGTAIEGPYARISDFYIGMGDGVSGYQYEHLDSGLSNGQTYYYKLEVLDSNQVAEFYGPISAVPGQPTPTRTATQTATRTPTSTPTRTPTQAFNPTATRTRTPTAALAQTNTPAAATSYPAGTPLASTPTSSAFLPTATLFGSAGTLQPSPEVGAPLLTPTPANAAGVATAVANSEMTPSSPEEDTPLDEEPRAAGIFESDLILWLGLGLGGLTLGGIVALVLWSLKRTKAG